MTSIRIKFPIRCYETGEVFHRYSDYLYSRHWKRVRIKQLSMHPQCYCCGEKATDIHHKCYARIGRETPKDVVSLCRPCHQTVHDVNEGLDSAHDTLEAILKKAQHRKHEQPVSDFVHSKRSVRIAGLIFKKDDLQNALFLPSSKAIRRQIGWISQDAKAIDAELAKCLERLDRIAARRLKTS